MELGYTKKRLQSIQREKVEIYTPSDMMLYQLDSYDEVIRYCQYVALGKYDSIGKLYVYLKYDKERDEMIIYEINSKWETDRFIHTNMESPSDSVEPIADRNKINELERGVELPVSRNASIQMTKGDDGKCYYCKMDKAREKLFFFENDEKKYV